MHGGLTYAKVYYDVRQKIRGEDGIARAIEFIESMM